LKGGDPTLPNNYRPISKLPALAKVLESLVSEQVKEYLNAQFYLSINLVSGKDSALPLLL